MKKWLWTLLAALPLQAVANEADPIAYKCYYCTPGEMEDVALAQGVGRHYVYDYSNLNIVGFEVENAGGNLLARPFAAEDWVETQFKGMMGLYNVFTGQMKKRLTHVEILAPGTEHGRTPRYLWGHHLSALHPDHRVAQDRVHRYLSTHADFQFLDTTRSGGRLLQLAHTLERDDPIVVDMRVGMEPVGMRGLDFTFHFDHATRRWTYVHAKDNRHDIQQTRDDFAPHEGTTQFRYGSRGYYVTDAFLQRLAWTSIPVHGTEKGYVDIDCERQGTDIQCYHLP